MNRITRSIALAGIAGSFALVACENPNARGSDDYADTPATTRPATDASMDRTSPRVTDTNQEDNGVTAINQSNSPEHIDITAQIRRAVMEDDSLSMAAKNITIVTDVTGTVTLRGDVESQAEKDSIAAKAAAVVGTERVVNELEVDP